MPLDPQLLHRTLQTPKTQDVTRSPIVTTIILLDPANAADIIGVLETATPLEAYNARLILCEFESDAVPPLVARLGTAGPYARREGLEVLWALLATEGSKTIHDVLQRIKEDLNRLLDDTTPLPDDLPPYIERDFRGRICDLAYIVVQHLLSPSFDHSGFRSLDDEGRNHEIGALKRRDFSLYIV